MAATNAKLEIIASVRDQMSRTFATMRQNATRFIDPIKASFRTFGKILFDVRSILGGIAAYLGARAFVNHAKDLAAAGAETERWATRLGITVEQMDALDYVAQRTGLSINGMRDGLSNLQEKLAEAAGGSSELRTLFVSLGVDALDPVTKQIREATYLLPELAQAFEQLRAQGRGGEIASIAERLFGGAGSEIAVLLNDGPRGIAAALGRVQELGVLTTAQAATARVISQAFADTERSLRGVQFSLLEAFGPEIVATLRTFGDLVRYNRDAIVGLVTEVGSLVAQGLGVAGQFALTVARGVLDAIDWIRAGIIETAESVNDLWSAVFGKTEDRALFVQRMFGDDPTEPTDRVREGLDALELKLGETGAAFEIFSAQWQERWRANRLSAEKEIRSVDEKSKKAAENSTDAWARYFKEFKGGFKEWIKEYDDVVAAARHTSQAIIQSLEGSLTTFFEDMIKGTKSLKDAFKDMLRSIVGDMIHEVSRMLARSVLRAIFGGLFGASASDGGERLDGPRDGMKRIAPGWQRGIGNGGGRGSDRGPSYFGGSVVEQHVHLHQVINAVDGQSAAAFFAQNRNTMLAVVADGMQRNQQLKSLTRRR